MGNQVSKVELAKALKAIKDVSTLEQFEKIKEIYIKGDSSEILSSVNGLSEQDEFIMLTKLMGTATHIFGLEQRPIIQGQYIVPDLFMTLKMGCAIKGKNAKDFSPLKCLIEVKSTEKNTFKIGGSILRRYRNISDLMGFPLFFAIRFTRAKQNALWTIIEDNRSSTSINVTYQSIIEDVRKVLWDEYTFMISPNLVVECTFSKFSKEGFVTHKEYGTQIKANFTNGKNSLTQNNSESLMTCGLLQTFNLQEFKIVKIDDDVTIQYLRPTLPIAFLADFIYKTNNLITDEFGNVEYDASKLVVLSDTDAHKTLITRQIIEVLAEPLVKSGLLFYGEIGDSNLHYAKWKNYGGIV